MDVFKLCLKQKLQQGRQLVTRKILCFIEICVQLIQEARGAYFLCKYLAAYEE